LILSGALFPTPVTSKLDPPLDINEPVVYLKNRVICPPAGETDAQAYVLQRCGDGPLTLAHPSSGVAQFYGVHSRNLHNGENLPTTFLSCVRISKPSTLLTNDY
jgi:hypothetical protein